MTRQIWRRAIVGAILTTATVSPAVACAPYVVDVRCAGAVGDGRHDDATAINAAAREALNQNLPLLLPPGTYKVSSPLHIDYTEQAHTGYRLISEGARIDGTSIALGPVLTVSCLTDCFYFHQEGSLFVDGRTAGYVVEIGRADLTDPQNSIRVDHLIVNNGGVGGGVRLNYVLDADLMIVADSAGRSAGIALEQVQFSRLRGAGSAAGVSGTGLLIENGYSFSNTIEAMDLEVAWVCLAITSARATHNTFISPYFNSCMKAVKAMAGADNVMISPHYGADVKYPSNRLEGVHVLP